MHLHRRGFEKMRKYKNLKKRVLTGIIGGGLLILLYNLFPPIFLSSIFGFCLVFILIFEWPSLAKNNPFLLWPMALLYPTIPFLFLILLNQNTLHQTLIPIIFLSVFANDTGAYFAGKSFGKHFIAPSISPRKTWEGFVGGYILAYFVLVLFLLFVSKSFSYLNIAATTLVVSAFALLGDLFESFLKRRAKVKDSGAILPGHGGILDRFDAILFVTIIFYCFKNFLIKIFGI